jgi:hypothetical protein
MTGGEGGPLCASNERMGVLEELQYTTGQGPSHDAYRSGVPVSASTLDAEASRRWPAFVDLAVDNGIGAVAAFPMLSSGFAVGVLTVYQDVSGALSAAQLDDGVVLAEVLTETVLSLQDAHTDGALAPGLDEVVAYRAQIHQASGMSRSDSSRLRKHWPGSERSPSQRPPVGAVARTSAAGGVWPTTVSKSVRR